MESKKHIIFDKNTRELETEILNEFLKSLDTFTTTLKTYVSVLELYGINFVL
ncbi:hypothetical protein WL556_13255 [Staphylococcus intermedius]|uniref:Uncharacterized protein n=1 Tax=Staphylococcus intermedius NCTC 11048 TaxID=1141106 RepID=A0A380FY47_STAIN|nr:hypothetical protein [Staphylococcus intermedius]SUM43655.1 Uncharacterised protein [Staphylococcus intermedius NCTC 11048]